MDQILKMLGRPGVYHILVVALLAVTWWSIALGNTAMTFYGFTPKFRCEIPQHNESGNAITYEGGGDDQSETVSLLSNITVSEDQCNYTLRLHTGETSVHRCSSWTYDTDHDNLKTIATEWNLVCDNKYKISMSNTIYFTGVFCGALIFGFISDCIGRKPTLAICLYLQMPISLAIAFIPNYLGFIILRFLLGVWLQGISTVSFVHCIEFFRQRYRGIVMVGFGVSWAFGQMLTSFLAYILSDWRQMQMAAAFVAVTTIPYFWWLPESPRWLLVKERYDEIVNIFILRAAKVNRLDISAITDSAHQQFSNMAQDKRLSSPDKPTESFLTMMKIRTLLKRQLIMCYTWCISSLAYYVFLFNISNLAGDRYINFAISATMEIAMNFVIIFIMAKFGRKKPLIICCLLVSVLCLVSGTLPKQVSGKDIQWVVTMFSLIGKMAMSAILCLIFVYAAELFPTFARGGCMALCGCSLRVGGMLAPQIIFLKNYTFTELPYIVIAAAVFLAAVLAILLPETNGKQMPNTIEEALCLTPLKKEDQQKENELLASGSTDTELDGKTDSQCKC